ncbi:MAG: Rid family hydrolase [Candidatus Omnitrophica bacterium]|nr:Rid family hydrolase [Candidatus Omnitrophota bacterium]
MECIQTNKPSQVKVSRFQTSQGVAEYHLTLQPATDIDFPAQLTELINLYTTTLRQLQLAEETAVFCRFFFSDIANQCQYLNPPFPFGKIDLLPVALSLVEQSPPPPIRIALWAYHIADKNLKKSRQANFLAVYRNSLTHYWLTNFTAKGNSSYQQTWRIFQKCARQMKKRGMNLADSLIRTWLFVRDIDTNYFGLVKARRKFFATCGLTPETHFVASSGIGGAGKDLKSLVTLDAYAISGLRQEQISYLSAPDYLSPTYLYGVTFERGTVIAYQDRKQVIISGTASIDSAGQVLYPGEVEKQLNRTLENISALLTVAGASMKDVVCFITYVRDPADQKKIALAMDSLFPGVPLMVLVAPVCRPAWLVEVEALATVPAYFPEFPVF